MNEMKVNELRAGYEITAIFTVKSLIRKRSRNDRDYLVFELTRDTCVINGYLWSALQMGNKIRPGCHVKVKGYVKSLNNTTLIVIKQIRIATELEANDNEIGCYLKTTGEKAMKRTEQLHLWRDSEEDVA
ncbi:MAG: hypothetical protein HZB31_04610 [Nitrospirae bacterium]|nr:hypothetical protein [Nitrospirota bacterium]